LNAVSDGWLQKFSRRHKFSLFTEAAILNLAGMVAQSAEIASLQTA
jgi:hypothetical protein